jgi:hypothetical protein
VPSQAVARELGKVEPGQRSRVAEAIMNEGTTVAIAVAKGNQLVTNGSGTGQLVASVQTDKSVTAVTLPNDPAASAAAPSGNNCCHFRAAPSNATHVLLFATRACSISRYLGFGCGEVPARKSAHYSAQ